MGFIYYLYAHRKFFKVFLVTNIVILTFGLFGLLRRNDLPQLLGFDSNNSFLDGILGWFYAYSVTPLGNLTYSFMNDDNSSNFFRPFMGILPSPIRSLAIDESAIKLATGKSLVDPAFNVSTGFSDFIYAYNSLGFVVYGFIIAIIIKTASYYPLTHPFHLFSSSIVIMSLFYDFIFWLPGIFTMFLFYIKRNKK